MCGAGAAGADAGLGAAGVEAGDAEAGGTTGYGDVCTDCCGFGGISAPKPFPKPD